MTAHLNLTPHAVTREDRADGTILLRSDVPMGRVARCTGEWLDRWRPKFRCRFFGRNSSRQRRPGHRRDCSGRTCIHRRRRGDSKGNINFPRFLTRRAAVVDRLFDGDASDVLRILQ